MDQTLATPAALNFHLCHVVMDVFTLWVIAQVRTTTACLEIHFYFDILDTSEHVKLTELAKPLMLALFARLSKSVYCVSELIVFL